jgi:hypothetical protein
MFEEDCYEWEQITMLKKRCYYCGKIKYCTVEESEQYYKKLKRAPIKTKKEHLETLKDWKEARDNPGFDNDLDDYYYIARLNCLKHNYSEDVKRLAATKIQLAWKECRDNPKYKMCHKIHIQKMEDDGYEFA